MFALMFVDLLINIIHILLVNKNYLFYYKKSFVSESVMVSDIGSDDNN